MLRQQRAYVFLPAQRFGLGARRRWLKAAWTAILLGCGSDSTRLLLEEGASPSPPSSLLPSDALRDAGVALGDAGSRPIDPAAVSPPDAGRPLPLPPGIANLPAQLELASSWRLVEAFPGISFDDPVALAEAPGTGFLFVSEREGKLYAFENREAVSEKRLVLDLSARNQGENDSGLLGIAFHPEFGQAASNSRSYLYVHYAYREGPIVGRTPPVNTRTRSRLSRFSLDLDTLVADAASELVLIDQDDDSIWHQGGALFFHPGDGFLYLSVGDEGGGFCRLGNCQRIDRDLFSGILRLDVDQRGGDVSHPIPRQPATGRTQGYFIPNDNPFVGQPEVLEEFYALGLRNPYRVTHDPVDDIVWIAEVGQEGREELDLLAPGANYQWNVFEGTLPSTAAMPATPLGVWTPPVFELNRQQALSIIGGYVYRGRRLPSLTGKYIFADFSRGRIWALPYQAQGGNVELGELELLMTSPFRDRVDGITSFGVDSSGELYLLTLGATAKIQKLEQDNAVLNAPLTLSATRVFRDLERLEPQAALASYSVQSPLWSDGAAKQRWMALPEGEQIGFSPTGPWSFPEGAVFVKHFELPLDEREPARVRRLETRLLVAGAGGEYYGLTYKWNAEGTDAELVTEPLFEDLTVADSGGVPRTQTWFYPSPRDCPSCHSAAAGYVLGVRTAQLNGAGDGADPLAAWLSSGLLRDGPRPAELAELPRLSGLADESEGLEQRVRSYWDSNCAMCHGVENRIRANWDARYTTPMADRRLVSEPAINGGDDGATLLIAPGDPARSILYQRDASLVTGQRMPPLASHRRDEVYLEVLTRWIDSLGPSGPVEAADAGPPSETPAEDGGPGPAGAPEGPG
jgi:uncharacterized repeat protein (TIGR03806 family)